MGLINWNWLHEWNFNRHISRFNGWGLLWLVLGWKIIDFLDTELVEFFKGVCKSPGHFLKLNIFIFTKLRYCSLFIF